MAMRPTFESARIAGYPTFRIPVNLTFWCDLCTKNIPHSIQNGRAREGFRAPGLCRLGGFT